MCNRGEIAEANNLFEQPWWLDIVAEKEWDEVLLKEQDKIKGRFPFYYNKKNHCIELPTLTQTCGIWMDVNKSEKGNEILSEKKDIIYALIEKLPKCKNIKIALDCSVDYILPFLWKGFKVIPRVSYRLENLNSIEDIYGNFSKTVKKNIKSAQKKVDIIEESNVDILLDIMDKTFAAQGRKYPISRDTIRKIVTECDKRGRGKMFTAIDKENNIHACSYFVFDEEVYYYLIAGSDSKFRSSGAQTLILWEAIKHAASTSKVFDFEGSMIEGIETFFRRFGGVPRTYYEIRKQTLSHEIFEVIKPRIKKVLGYKS